MAINVTSGGTAHVKALANAALETVKGVKVELPNKNAAVRLRQSFHAMRVAERKDSRKMYDETDPRHDSCAYDCIETLMDVDDTGTWYIIFRTNMAALQAYKITNLDNDQEIKEF